MDMPQGGKKKKMINVGVLGSGPVGQALVKGFCKHGYDVRIGSRTPDSDKMKAFIKEMGGKVSAGSFAEVAAYGEIIVLATLGEGTEQALDIAGPEKFAQKLVLDATNQLDFSKGMPPGLLFPLSDSLGERVQRKLQSAKVVKCFNTVPNTQMIDPQFKDVQMLICGNDGSAKREAASILKEFGWAGSIDIGGIENARWLEALVPLWVRVTQAVGSRNALFKVVKE